MNIKKYLVASILSLILCTFLSGCMKNIDTGDAPLRIYYFDNINNQLIDTPIKSDLEIVENSKKQVEYLIDKLMNHEYIKENSAVPDIPVPIKGAITDINKRSVKINFKEEYSQLSTNQQIGVRAAIVYSLTQLESIDSIDFYVLDKPLTSSNGKVIGPISRSNIKLDEIEPNPAITPYTLPLYFVNDEGKLVKEDRGIRVSDPTSVEKSLIEELIKGPNSPELKASLPPEVKVNAAVTVNGVCQVDLSFDIKSKFFTSNEDKERMIYAIVNSLTEITELTNSAPKIKKVAFLIDGKSDIKFTNEIQLKDTFERNEEYIE